MKHLRFSIFSVLITFLCLCATTAYADSMAATINKAGKQRMLTQKMSKEVLLIAAGIDADANKANLAKTVSLFDTTLKTLIDGNKNKEIDQQLHTVSGLWKAFGSSVTGETTPAVLASLATQNMPLLKEMNKAVKMYEKSSGSTLSPEMAATINKAGKQRMLTQKMTKELLLIANGVAAEANKANLAGTVVAFEKALGELRSANQNAAIANQLRDVQNLWEQYKPILSSVDVSKQALASAAKLNLPLLKEMNKAVGMYAK
ncbi:Methyl-accepting chemotaxis protein [hydrothermal vent metagenome]|uniref:Methyl-accepting chemotaxis protein n=1 Tax=hydrothermal vent metagenome TaxID=652676 RepID=A0A3B1BCZ4_9ZZZZ